MSSPIVCGAHYQKLSKSTTTGKQILFNPLRCGRWDCETCRHIKVAKIRKAMKKLFAEKKLYMLTVTDMHKTTAEEAWKTWGKRWNRFRTYITKKYGKFSYIRIMEPHKGKPYPHMHCIMTAELDKLDIAKHLEGWGFGNQWDLQPIDNKGAMYYVTKYLTKDWPENGAEELRKLTKVRIVQGSRDLGAIHRQDTGWKVEINNIDKNRIARTLQTEYIIQHRRTPYRVRLNIGKDTYLININNTIEEWERINTDISKPEDVEKRNLTEREHQENLRTLENAVTTELLGSSVTANTC